MLTPRGIRILTKDKNNGIEEQEQKGVRAPNMDAPRCARSLFLDSTHALTLLSEM
jgi:hypothetical protein